MRLTYLSLSMALLIARGAAACECPPTAPSREVLVAVTGRGAASGLVVCGQKESENNGSITASYFEVFDCDTRQTLLYFDAIMRARLESRRGQLEVTEISRWPFGRAWQWVDVPVLHWSLKSGDRTAPPPRLVAPRPSVTAAQVDAFLAEYRQFIRAGRAADEEMVARLFTAAMTGNVKAATLFRTMSKDARLDGHAGETYSYAEQTFRARWGRQRHGKN